MKNLLILLFLISCAATNNKVGDLFLYEDKLKNKNSDLIGTLYFKNKKLVFIENKALNKDEISQEKTTAIKLKLNQINKDGYLKVLTFSKPTLSPDGKTIDSENHIFRAIYLEDKDFLENLEREIFYHYQAQIILYRKILN